MAKKKKKSPTIKTGKPTFIPKVYVDTETASMNSFTNNNFITSISCEREPLWVGGTGLSAGPGYNRSYTIDVDASSFVGQVASTAVHDGFQNAIVSHVNTAATLGNVQFASGDSITIRTNAIFGSYEIPTMSVNGTIVTLNSVVYDGVNKEESLRETVKQIMRSNLLIRRGRDSSLDKAVNPNEIKARNTLRDHITERSYRRYLTNGFIMVRGQSGLCYQVFNDRRHTMVFHNNQKVGEICINTDYSCPPTDHVITIKMMIELDEVSVWDGGNLKRFSKGFQIPFQVSKSICSYVNIDEDRQARSASPIKETNLVEAYKQAKLELKAA